MQGMSARPPRCPSTSAVGLRSLHDSTLDIGAFESQVVTSLPSATALVSSLNPATVGQTVTFTATVTGSGGTPTGTVTFMDGAATLGTGTLNGAGLATFTTSALVAGTHPVTAVYGGDATYAGSTSGIVNQSIVGAGLLVFAGNTATGTGVASVTMTTASGGAACGFTSGTFVPVSSVPIAPPAGVHSRGPRQLPDRQLRDDRNIGHGDADISPAAACRHGLLEIRSCDKGAAPTWYMLPGANVAGNQITFTLTDGQQGDDDWSVNGVLADPGGPGTAAAPAAQAAPIPVLSGWASLVVAAALIFVLAAQFAPHAYASRRRG